MLSGKLTKALTKLYEAEINCQISSFFDEGWTVKIGDPLNGFKAQAEFRDLKEAADWLLDYANSEARP
jgi:hypothetical protein